MANYPVKFVQLSQAKFNELSTKDKGTLYFLPDVGQIYKGDVLFSGTVLTKSGDTGKQGVLYVDGNNKLFVGTGTGFKEIAPLATTLDATDDVKAPTSKAVDDYLKSKLVSEVAYDETNQAIKVTKYGEADPTALSLKGMLAAEGVTYSEGTLTLPVVNGDDVVINLPKENFVKSGSYDAESESIVLVLEQPDAEGNEQKVVIPVSALVDISDVQGSATLQLNMNASKVISGAVKISAEEGNLISTKEDGLYVSPVDISGKLDVLNGADADEVVTVKADGQVQASGNKVGGATLAADPNATTLATEVAVKAADTALDTKLTNALNDGLALKVDKTSIATTVAASTDASDEKVASEKAVATVKEEAAANLEAKAEEINASVTALETKLTGEYVEKANISTTIPAADAVDTKVASEKAVADVRTTLEAADQALLEAVQNVNNAKVDKANIVTEIASDSASSEKVASEKAVADLATTIRAELAAGLAWDDQYEV